MLAFIATASSKVGPTPFPSMRNHEQTADFARPRRRVEVISEDELRRRESALEPGLGGALFLPDDAVVDSAWLTRQVAPSGRVGLRVHSRT